MIQVALDFAPGLHGHFLELVLNKYIYGIPFNGTHVFQPSTGAVHAINVNDEYQKSKVVLRNHYSYFKNPYPKETKKIVFINNIPALDFILLTNIYHRCHPDSIMATDFNVEEIKKLHEQQTGCDSNLELRNNWFSKLNENHCKVFSVKQNTLVPVYSFDYASFFNLNNFCIELQKTARFLEKTFKFDTSLSDLWHDFMQRNQGWTLYQQAESILASTVSKQPMLIPDDWKLHAYLNFRLSKKIGRAHV